MFARYHGETPRLAPLPVTLSETALFRAFSAVGIVEAKPGTDFGYMFPDLVADPANRLPEGSDTIAALRDLGIAMGNDPSNAEGIIPAAYTYFGQFIDHDITKTVFSPDIGTVGGLDIIETDNFQPLAPAAIAASLRNDRTSVLDLDNLYGGLALEATNADGSMRLGTLSVSGLRAINSASRDHDLPRRPRIENPANLTEREQDRQALIGDPRNDENLLVGQLHVAFLRSHNVLHGRFGATTKREMRRRYQWAVLHDFLKRICDPVVHGRILSDGASFFTVADAASLSMPVEFSGAAYRFGHSMVRQKYEHNSTFNSAPGALAEANFNFMFTFTALSGSIAPAAGPGGFDTLPDNWTIEWHRFFNETTDPASATQNPARRIDTQVAPELALLPDFVGFPIKTLMGKLASRNLLRGYLLGLPTGQAVATKIGAAPLPRDTILNAVPDAAKASFEAAGLADRTPLWFYVLAEAGDPSGPDGKHLGAVGSTIVVETLWTLVRHSPDSVLVTPPSDAEIATGEYTLRGLVKLGQDANLPPL